MKHTLLLQRKQFERKKTKTNSGNEYEQQHHVTIKIDNNVNKLGFLMPRAEHSTHIDIHWR